VNQNLLAVFSTYYLWIGLFRVGLCAFYANSVWVMKTQLILILAGLLYSTGMGSGLLLRAVQEPTYYKIRLLKLQIIRLPLYNTLFFIGVYTMGNVQFIWFLWLIIFI
jgi:hypothetical protein